jgi:maltose O-acetyltransferase
MSNSAVKLSEKLKHRLLAFSYSRLFPFSFRVKLLRFCGSKIGIKSSVNYYVSISNPENITIGNHVIINMQSVLEASESIIIEDYVRLGPGVMIITGTHSIMDAEIRQDPLEYNNKPVRIEYGCWIGARATILPGVTVAKGCVIGAGAVVNKSTEVNGLYVGVPAIRVRSLPIKEGLESEIRLRNDVI